MSQTKTQLVEGLDLASAPADSLVIDTNGKIGVGTTDPGPANIAVVQARDASNYARFSIGQNRDGQGSTGGNHLGLWYGFSNSDRADVFTSTGNMNFWVDGAADGTGQFTFGRTFNTEWMRIDDSGRLGIGTNGPTSQLHIQGDTPFIKVSNTAETRSGITFFDSADETNQFFTLSYSSGTGNGVDFDTTPTGADYAYRFLQGGTERVRIDSSGRLLVGTTADVSGTSNTSVQIVGNTNNTNGELYLCRNDSTVASSNPIGTIEFRSNHGGTYESHARIQVQAEGGIGAGDKPGRMLFFTTPDGSATPIERMRISSSGNVGIGGLNPINALHINGAAGEVSSRLRLSSTEGSGFTIRSESATETMLNVDSSENLLFGVGGGEVARIDSSGRLLVGTSSGRATYCASSVNPQVQIEGTGFSDSSMSLTRNANSTGLPSFFFGKTRGTSVGDNGIVANDDELGSLEFQGNDGSKMVRAAMIRGGVDGTPGSNDMPGRLVFYTTEDGGTDPTERMRIDSTGGIYCGTTNGSVATQNSDLGVVLNGGDDGRIYATASAHHDFNRTADGEIFRFRSAATTEGNISVSGTTVQLNGAHLSRWSQLPGGAERIEILRGTVLSNLDEMCEWGEEENEQLNRMKVSDVDGDKNVAGVFVAWDNDDDTYTNDFYCAMTGDFVIRIAQGVTVERGDLLMSAGDGTAKPQDDDIIRSKTIAKVTSTNVSCTYDDGSYCVPCVLMAC